MVVEPTRRYGLPSKMNGAYLSGGWSFEHDHRAAVIDVDAAHLDSRRRLEPPKRRRDIAQRNVRDLLPNDLPVRRHADQHLATFAVQEGAQCLAHSSQLGGRALELERLGLALGDEQLERGERGHGHASPTSVSRHRLSKLNSS
jgi:hypothetical protein